MKAEDFLNRLDDAKVVAAIARAEEKMSGEIRVCVSHRKRHDGLEAARRRFAKLRMHRTRERNAVLLYFAPRSQQFAVWGDIGVHEKCGERFWQDTIGKMAPLLRANCPTEAVILAVEEIGAVLAKYFPRRPDDHNELPDTLIRG
jgi:uncharacterized membrane protein